MSRAFNPRKFFRQVHYWGAIISALPVLIVIVTGVLLLLKKESTWIQPATIRGSGKVPSLSFESLLEAVKAVPEAGISSWKDVDRLDVRPSKGVIKVRAENRWEIQVDHRTGKILQTAFRRSDIIESMHDSSFFHDRAKMWIFLPSALILLLLWLSGLYLFWLPLPGKFRKWRRKRSTAMKA